MKLVISIGSEYPDFAAAYSSSCPIKSQPVDEHGDDGEGQRDDHFPAKLRAGLDEFGHPDGGVFGHNLHGSVIGVRPVLMGMLGPRCSEPSEQISPIRYETFCDHMSKPKSQCLSHVCTML